MIRIFLSAVFICGYARPAPAVPLPEAPPPEWSGKKGDYRSPLQFDDGSRVTDAAGWKKRRGEILDYWHAVMGEWPPVLEKPGMEVLSAVRRETFQQSRVRLEIAPGQSGEGWLLRPDGDGPFPAVLVVYYEPETSTGQAKDGKHEHRDYALQLTRLGLVTLSIGTPGGNAWKPERGQAQCQPLSFHAYVAANAWRALAALPEVDSRRIGIVGHSYGGKWALFAGALWEKFAAVAVSDPGIVLDEKRPNVNYWEPWYLGWDATLTSQRKAGVPSAENPRTGAYAKLVAARRDLTDLHALICPRPFLVSGGAEDPPERWTALNHARAVNELLGYEGRVVMTNRPEHAPNAEANQAVMAFFQKWLGKPAR